MRTGSKRSRRTSSGFRRARENGSALKEQSRIADSEIATMKNFLESPYRLKGKWWTHQAILKGQSKQNGTIEILVRYANPKDPRNFSKDVAYHFVLDIYSRLLRNFCVTETLVKAETKRRKS